MPHYIAEVHGRLAIWSTVVDAPITPFVGSIDHLREVAYRDRDHLDELPRVGEGEIAWNRAGAHEECLSVEDMLAAYADEPMA